LISGEKHKNFLQNMLMNPFMPFLVLNGLL